MPVSVDVEQRSVFWLMEDLQDASRNIKSRVADVYQTSGPTFVRTAVRLAPEDTGALKRSIGYTVNRRIPRIRIGSIKRSVNPKSGRLAMSYARYVHDGTSRMPPRPFVSQSIAKHTTPQGAFMRGLRKAGVANIGRSTGGLR